MNDFEHEKLGYRFKGLPRDAAFLTGLELGRQNRNLFTGGFSWPVMTLRQSAVVNNAKAMSAYARDHGLKLAPHLKTSMSPQLAEYAAREGSWGVTVATPYQAGVFMEAGECRILMANELVDGVFAAEASAWQAGSERTFLAYVDSLQGVEILAANAAEGMDVLVELGHPGGRTGVRDLADVRLIVEAISSAKNLRLRGIAGYEGSVSHSRSAADLEAVRTYLRSMASIVEEYKEYFVSEEPVVVSAGGSIYFDCVAEVLSPANFPDLNVETIIRSGAYLTHDSGFYSMVSPLDGHKPSSGQYSLMPAITVWAQVLSRPEPEQVILGAGRRDLNTDEGMPVVQQLRTSHGDNCLPLTVAEVTHLNDQHAFLKVSAGAAINVGDLVGLGISHPCTVHDKWLAPLLVDDQNHVVAILRSYF